MTIRTPSRFLCRELRRAQLDDYHLSQLFHDHPTEPVSVSGNLDAHIYLGLISILFFPHNLAVVEHIATKVAVMYLGRIVEEAETETLFTKPQHPYTEALLSSVLTPDPNLDVPDTHLGAAYPNPVEPPSGCTLSGFVLVTVPPFQSPP